VKGHSNQGESVYQNVFEKKKRFDKLEKSSIRWINFKVISELLDASNVN
jgi:hypothetical protein